MASNKVAIVTAGGSGMGAHAARTLARDALPARSGMRDRRCARR